MEPIVGIDLGTTNSEIAYIFDGAVKVLTENDNGILPSCVGIDSTGKIIVGHEAVNQAALYPENTVLSIKRLMGSNEKIRLKDTEYRPQEISAFILKALKERAERILNKPVSKAVITVPAYFTDAQRKATREAGEIAGLNVIRILNEPTAAALAYESTNPEAQQLLVYDLGGGTFDVSIVKMENSVVEVLSSTGDNHLGGDDFDDKIVRRLLAYIEKEHHLTISDNPAVLARLRRAAEKAKIALSDKPYTLIEEDHIAAKGNKQIHLSYELSRQDFEQMIADDLSKTMESINKAVEDANLLVSDIDKIILVGGSTRIPALSRMLEKKFNIQAHSEIDPDLCVAMGAGIQAGREMGMDNFGILLDITPYTFGTSALGEVNGEPCMDMFVPMIKRNTKLPVSKSEAFYTVYDNQEAVEIKVYQGEKPHAMDNIKIGEYLFTLSKAPAKSIIIMNFDLDINGILKIEAVEKHTNRTINAVIENAFSEFSQEELSASKERIQTLWPDQDTRQNQDTPTQKNPESNNISQSLIDIIDRAKTGIETAPDEDRDEIINLIEDIQDALNEGKIDEAEAFGTELEDILFYIE